MTIASWTFGQIRFIGAISFVLPSRVKICKRKISSVLICNSEAERRILFLYVLLFSTSVHQPWNHTKVLSVSSNVMMADVTSVKSA